jgi:hypothetical protein
MIPTTNPPLQKRKLRWRPLDFIQRVTLFIVTFAAFAASIIALLTYFNILPSAFLPLVHWVEHNIFSR